MKKALVIVSFGTTYERARRSIDAVERALAQAAEGYDVFRAYTSSIVRKVLKSRGEIVPSLEEALEKLANESYDTVFVQPTHLLCGNEYDEKIRASYMRYAGRFLRGGIGKPLIANNDDLLKLAEIWRLSSLMMRTRFCSWGTARRISQTWSIPRCRRHFGCKAIPMSSSERSRAGRRWKTLSTSCVRWAQSTSSCAR